MRTALQIDMILLLSVWNVAVRFSHLYYILLIVRMYIHVHYKCFQTAKEKGAAGGSGEKENIVHSIAAFILTLPGKVLDISALNSQHQFQERGKKQGAVDAIEHLEEAGLGIIHKERATRATAMVSATCDTL